MIKSSRFGGFNSSFSKSKDKCKKEFWKKLRTRFICASLPFTAEMHYIQCILWCNLLPLFYTSYLPECYVIHSLPVLCMYYQCIRASCPFFSISYFMWNSGQHAGFAIQEWSSIFLSLFNHFGSSSPMT